MYKTAMLGVRAVAPVDTQMPIASSNVGNLPQSAIWTKNDSITSAMPSVSRHVTPT